jgi:hypothetical protein
MRKLSTNALLGSRRAIEIPSLSLQRAAHCLHTVRTTKQVFICGSAKGRIIGRQSFRIFNGKSNPTTLSCYLTEGRERLVSNLAECVVLPLTQRSVHRNGGFKAQAGDCMETGLRLCSPHMGGHGEVEGSSLDVFKRLANHGAP